MVECVLASQTSASRAVCFAFGWALLVGVRACVRVGQLTQFELVFGRTASARLRLAYANVDGREVKNSTPHLSASVIRRPSVCGYVVRLQDQ